MFTDRRPRGRLRRMWSYLRRMTQFFLAGFVITFLVYLFIRIGTSEVVYGALISVAGGIILCLAITLLERRFPEQAGEVTGNGRR